MILVLPNAFLSIVAHHDDPELVVARARFDGDIERAFALCGECDGCSPINQLPDPDFRFRAALSQKCLARIIVVAASAIDYHDFLHEVSDSGDTANGWMHDTYLDVWRRLHRERAGERGG